MGVRQTKHKHEREIQMTASQIKVTVYYTGTYGDAVDAIAASAGASCSQNVDRANSDGTGTAVLLVDADQLDYLTDMLEENETIESYKVFH